MVLSHWPQSCVARDWIVGVGDERVREVMVVMMRNVVEMKDFILREEGGKRDLGRDGQTEDL